MSVQSLLGLCCPERVISNARDADSHIGQGARRIQFHKGGGATDCKAGGLLRHLQVGASIAAGPDGNLNLPNDLVGFQCRRHHVEEELRCWNGPFPFRSERDDGCIEGEDARGIIRCRIRMRQTAADRAFIAYLHVPDQTRSVSESLTSTRNDIGCFKHVVSLTRRCGFSRPLP